jgi:hypothetical protein
VAGCVKEGQGLCPCTPLGPAAPDPHHKESLAERRSQKYLKFICFARK